MNGTMGLSVGEVYTANATTAKKISAGIAESAIIEYMDTLIALFFIPIERRIPTSFLRVSTFFDMQSERKKQRNNLSAFSDK